MLLGVAVGFECAKPPPPTGPFPALSYDCFVKTVEPELQQSCAFRTCHGKVERPLHLYSMAGERGPNANASDFTLSDEEHQANFQNAVVYASATSAGLPDLLRKPLQLEQGGAGHGGVDRFGRNVYGSQQEAGWQALSDWVNGVACDTGAGGGGEGGGTAMAGGGGTSPGGGGTGTGGGSSGPQCLPRAADWDSISQFVNAMNCADNESCHQVDTVNSRDAGCFLPTSCEAVRQGGCETPLAVVPCNPLLSRFWRYSGPFPFKNHNDRFPPGADVLIGEWIDAGASCDGGGAFP